MTLKKPYLILSLGVVAVALFFWVYVPTLSKYRDLNSQEEFMDLEIAELEAKIKALKQERDLLENDPKYVEKVIRDELGLVKPGEIVYKFVPEDAGATLTT